MTMTIFKRLSPLGYLCAALQHAFWPTFWRVWASPSLLLRPAAVSRIFMSHVWTAIGPSLDGDNAQVKVFLITQNAYGVVLDLGAAHGYTAKYLDPTRVTKYVALEPNVHMHDDIRHAAAAAGFTESSGTLVLLGCGAEDTSVILSTLGANAVDTLISVFALCSVPRPRETIWALTTEVLRPGGQMLFYEHVRSPVECVAWWQAVWSPVWALAYDGCRMDQPTDVWIREVGGWASGEVGGLVGEDEEDMFWHQLGRFVKAE